MISRNRQSGFTLIIAMVFLSLVSVLATQLVMSASTSLAAAENGSKICDARLCAESGLEYHLYLLDTVEITGSSSTAEALDALAILLADLLDGTANLQGQLVTYDGSTIVIPSINLCGGGSFRAEMTAPTAELLRLTVIGRAATANGTVDRSISMDAQLVASAGSSGSFGIYSAGPVDIGSGFNFVGANSSNEASIVSGAPGVAIAVEGGCIDGDVGTTEPGATVNVGATVNGEILTEVEVDTPVIDVSVFEPFATTIIDENTDTSSGTFTNVRIQANTNPEFGTVTILGVMYIEAPNRVSFESDCSVTGVIVSKDPGPGASPSDHRVYFKNDLTVNGLDELPDVPGYEEAFATLRDMAGSAFLLPGFTLDFKNNFSTVGGHMVAEQIIAKNNVEGTVHGSIIALGSDGLEFKNNAEITIDSQTYGSDTPGVIPASSSAKQLSFIPTSYTEN